MENRVQYIIDLVVQDKQLRKQMANVDWEKIIGSSGKGMSDAFAKETKDATDKIKNTFHGLNIDWNTILGSKDLSRLEQQMAKVLASSKKQISAFAATDDTSGIQRTVEYVAELGNQLKSLGSSFDAAQLARGMTSFMKVLTPLSAKIDALAKEPAKVEAAFDKLFNGNISNGVTKVSQGFTIVGDAASKASVEANQAIQKMEKSLSSIDALFNKEYSIKFNSDLEEQFYLIDEEIEKVDEDISKLEDKFSKMTSSSKGFNTTRSQLVQKYVKQSELYRKLDLIDKQYTSKHSKNDSLLTLNNIVPEDIINEAKQRIKLFINDANLQLKEISKSTKTTQDGINIPIKLPTQNDLIKTINQYVDEINKSKAIHTIKINLDDPANLIEDKQKRAYGLNEADDDVNTTKIVAQTEKRFDKITDVIKGKQNKILENTKTWRKDMLNQFKFKSGDFDFKFNDSLIDSLQSLFDDYFLKVNIDPNYLADQIKTVLNSNDNTISGGTANIDANSMAAAIATGLKSVLFGDKIQIPQGNGSKNVDGNTLLTGEVPSNTEYIATEIEGAAKHLDLAEDYVKDVVAKLKAVAKYASKDSSGAKATKTRFNELGIDLSKVKTASDVGNDAEIVSIIEKAFLQRDELGNLKGSTISSELSKFKGSSSKTIPAFIDSMDEVFYMLQEDTQSIEDWTRKRHSKEILDSARGTAKAANALRGVRSTIRQGGIPDGKSIENAISLITDIGKNTDNLQLLKTAREVLGDKTDDAAISEFRTAADNFYKSSTKTFWDLKEQAEDTFKGTVFFQDKNGKKYGKYYDSYKQLANIKDDSIIVDVQVSSSLNNTTLGTVKSKYSNRTSQSGEKQLMRNASRTDYIVPREYESDILNKKLNYQGFKPQNVSSVPIDFDATIERQKKDIVQSEGTITELHKNITSLEQKINEKQSEVEHLKKTLALIGEEPVYQTHTNENYVKKFDALYSLNKNSKVTSESELPKDGYSTEISNAIDKKNILNNRLAELSKQAKLVEKLTIEEARTRLQRLSEGLVSDEEMALYQKFIDNPIDKDVLNKNVEVKGYSKEEIQKLKKLSPGEANVLLQRGRTQRESIDLYSRFIQDPDSVRKDIYSSIQQVTKESVSNQKNLDSYILAWAKSEEEKIPEAKAILERAVKNVLSKVVSTMRSLYSDIVNTEEQLNGNISDDERQVLTAHMQDSLELFYQAQKEYNSLISQNKITRKKPLSEDKFKKITSLQSQYQGSIRNELNSSIASTTSELGELISQKSKLNQQELEITTQQKHSEGIIKRSEAEKEYNQLLEKSLMLEGSIKKMEEDGASENALKKKQKELDGVNARLSESKAKVEALGGFFGQGNDKEYSDNEKKSYALREIEKIDNDLITAKAQKRVVESRISKKDREIADLDKWGLSAGIGASTLAKTKGNLTFEFMSGDYVRAKEDALRERAKTTIIESENESKKIFDEKVATAMEYLGWNPLDQVQVKKFLNTEHGQQLSNDFASEVDTNTTNIWKQYDEFRKDLLSKLKKEFQDSFKVDKGILTATTKTQDETGNWIDEIVEVRVREALKTRLEEEKRILESQQQPIQSNIDKLEADKVAAIEYGGISDKELLSGEVIKNQIRKEEYLAKLKEDRIVAQEKINNLEEANVDRSSDDYKSAKKDLGDIDKEIARYEMLIKNRQKLVQMRYDESKEPTYTDEEKELHFTNQIVSCNEKIESSLVKQKNLKEQIATATGDDKAKLERSLSLEEEKVSKWNDKKLKYETKLNRLQGSKDIDIAGAILPEGGIVGSIMSAVKETIGSVSGDIQIDTTELAKDSTLRAILEVLGGVPQTIDDGYGLGRGKKTYSEYNDAVSVGYDRIQKLTKIRDSGTTGPTSTDVLLRVNRAVWDKVKSNNFFNDIPEDGLQRFLKINEVISSTVKEVLQSAGMTEKQVVEQLQNVRNATGGYFKSNGYDSGWNHFATYNENGNKHRMQKDNGVTYKVYAAFENIEDLNANIVSSIMEELSKEGFKGRLKTTSGATALDNKIDAIVNTDQLVIHGASKKDQEIAYTILRKMGLNLSYLGGGIDTPDGSFTQTLSSNSIGKYVNIKQKQDTKEPAINDPKTIYKSWNVKLQDLDFDTVKAKAVALKQVIDTLYDEGKSDTQEFINAQTELSKLLSAWRNKIGKTTNPELYGKTGKENWMSYLTSGDTKIFDNLDNVELSSISQKDYLSRLRKVGIETSNTKPTTEQTLQIKNFDEFKSQVQALSDAIKLQKAGSEEQKKRQAAFVQVLQAWAKNEASGFGGKLPNAKGWESYLISSGVFDSIDTSITPLTSRQLNKGSKTKNTTSKKTVEQRTDTPKKTESHTETAQSETRQTTGGLLQLVGQLAQENTLLQVLSALQTIGTVEGGKPAPTAAGDLYNQFKALLLGSSIDDYERLAYMNSKEGLLSGNVIGNIANISEELINALRAKYPNAQGFDTQIHTHGKSIDPYFSDEDYQHFTKDYESGIKKQVLLTKDDISVLDLTAVKSAEEVQGLMDELIKAGNNAEAIKKVFETDKSGAIFETAKFDSLNANSLVKMLGAKGVKSNDTMTEINAVVSKVQTAREAMTQAINVGYLSKDDTNLAEFDKILDRTNEISESIKNGTTSYEAQKDELDKLTNSATRYSDIINSAIGKNKRAYVGVSEVNSVNKQRDKIIGTFGSEDEFNNSNIALVRQYDEAVKNLNATYKELTDNQRIQNENERQSLSQQASQVQALGKHLLSSISEAEKLKQLVDQSGIYKDKKGNFQSLGGSTEINIDNIKNLDTVMRNYVQNTLGQVNIEHAKFDATNQRLTYSFRTSQKTVADMVVQYDDLTKSLYAYQKQERESLSGLPGLMQGFKSKLHSILQYTASITSIYRVFGELKRGIQYVREIDSALTELKKVTDETEATYDKFLNTAAKTADKVGSTISEVVSSTADWARLGYSLEDAANLAESTSVLLNVSEFQSIDDATSALVSTMQAFGYAAKDSMHVVDVMNEIGELLPIDNYIG